MTDFVVGVDVSPRGFHLGYFHQSGHVAAVMGDFPEVTERDHNLKAAVTHAKANTETVFGEVLAKGKPRLVVMNKLLLFDMDRDPSGARRAALWWQVVNALTEADIPVAEIPPMTAQSFMGRNAEQMGVKPQIGRRGFDHTKSRVRDTWRKANGGELHDDNVFRYYTIAHAAMGALALGWDIAPLEVNYERLKMLRSASCDFPSDMELPKTEVDWATLNGKLKLGV